MRTARCLTIFSALTCIAITGTQAAEALSGASKLMGVATSKYPGKVHVLAATMETTQWGWFDNAQAPVLRVNSGDTVVLELQLVKALAERMAADLAALAGLVGGVGASNNWAIGGRWPDLVVFISVPLDVLLDRLKKRELDRWEREDRSFFERVLDGYKTMAAADPDRWLIVDGLPPKNELEPVIAKLVRQRLTL